MKKNNKGFTLVELIVVLVILAILAAILVPTLLGYIDKARSEKDFSTAQTMRVAAQAAIDQAYGNSTKPNDTTANITSIGDMDGTFQATLTGGAKYSTLTNTYAKSVYELAGVDDSKVTAFLFNYEDGIIKTGYVLISGKYYKLSGGNWEGTGTTEPKFS